MRGLAFSPQTLNQLTAPWQVFDKIDAEPGEQCGLRHCSFKILGR
jgi:hypothetical protein